MNYFKRLLLDRYLKKNKINVQYNLDKNYTEEI